MRALHRNNGPRIRRNNNSSIVTTTERVKIKTRTGRKTNSPSALKAATAKRPLQSEGVFIWKSCFAINPESYAGAAKNRGRTKKSGYAG
jgi:hypothetical protein